MDYKSLPMPKTRLTGKKCKFIIDEVTTPIRSKPKNRKASVEVIADTEIPIGWTSPSASTKKKTHTLRTLVCDLHLVEFNASTPFEREKIDVDQLVWSEYHAALFDQVMVPITIQSTLSSGLLLRDVCSLISALKAGRHT